jgi:sec-independent protein translocase protein TatC
VREDGLTPPEPSTPATIGPDPTAGSPDEPSSDDEVTMSLIEHLEELRRRVIVIAIAVGVAAIGGFFLADPLIVILRAALPADADAQLITTTVAESFSVRIQVALVTGLALAMPVILYEIWAFVTPGLTRSERRLVWPLLGVAILLFAAGIALGYLLIPLAINFLLDFSLPGVQPLLRLSEYVGFVTTFLLAFGIALQFPVVLFLLARLGILSYGFLARRRRAVVVLIALFAMLITPGDIVIGSASLAIVMYGLFEITLQLIRFMHRRRRDR